MPCDYSKYPSNWKTHIVPAIRERSGEHCEWCGVRNKAVGDRDPETGAFIERPEYAGAPIAEIDPDLTQIILTVAHLDHDLAHNDGMDAGGPALPIEEANLVHLCQRCHLRHDRPANLAKRMQRRDEEAGQLGLL